MKTRTKNLELTSKIKFKNNSKHKLNRMNETQEKLIKLKDKAREIIQPE